MPVPRWSWRYGISTGGRPPRSRIRNQIEDAKLRVIHLDLADLSSVRDFAAEQAATGPLDLLVNNAGLMLVPRRELTRDGFEMQMGVNHLGHFALTAGLLPALLQAPAGRVVSVTSIAARRSRSLDHGMGLVGNYTPMRRLQPVETRGRVVRRRTRPPIAGRRVPVPPRSWRIRDGRRPPWSAPMTIPASRSGSAAGTTAIFGASPRAGARPQVYAATAPDVVGRRVDRAADARPGCPASGSAHGRRHRPGRRGLAVGRVDQADRGGAASGHPVNGA